MYGQSHDGARPAKRRRTASGAAAGAKGAETAILAATKRLLAEVPLQELSVAEIISAAETSRATFYFYFSSKYAVLTVLVEQAAGEIYRLSRPFLARTDSVPVEAALHRRIADSAQIWNAHRSVLQATVENWHAVPDLRTAWLKVIDGLTRAIATEIDIERAAGRAPSGPDSRQLAAVLAWTTEACLYAAGVGAHDSLTDEDETVAALTRLWLGAVYGAASGGEEAAA